MLTEVKVEDILMGMCSQICEREDAVLCSDVRDKLFGPMEFSRRDLGSLNIMRGRDMGLPDYNSARVAFNLPKKLEWHDIAPDLFDKNPGLEQSLIAAYENRLDNIDAYVGGMLESDGKPGELFQAVINEQFIRIRDADRFWFENENNGYVLLYKQYCVVYILFVYQFNVKYILFSSTNCFYLSILFCLQFYIEFSQKKK